MRMKPAFEIRERSRVYVGPVGDLLTGALPEGRVVVVTDATVERLFAPLLAPYERLLVGQGEASKTLRTVGELYERLIDLGADRSTFILGVGGGIVTDVAGFVASTYMRGLRFGSGTRRIKYDGSKTFQFRGIQRIFKQVFDGCFNIGNHILID